MDHMVGGQTMVAGVLSGSDFTPASDGPAGQFAAATAAVLDASRLPGALEREIKSPMGTMPAGAFLMGSFMDVLIHGWDLAKATGQDTALPADLAEAYYAVFAPQIDGWRGTGNFGPAVPVPSGASAQDKLIGVMGRQP